MAASNVKMAAPKFTLDAAIQFQLGCTQPSESLTNSHLVAKFPGRWVWIGQQFNWWRAVVSQTCQNIFLVLLKLRFQNTTTTTQL
jgi:hypothetical protein